MIIYNDLRRRGYRPHYLVHHDSSKIFELISYPYPDNNMECGEPVIKIRVPGDPTTINTEYILRLQILQARCPYDGHIWHPWVEGEFLMCHVHCQKCDNKYYARYENRQFYNEFISETYYQSLILDRI